jgi:carbonic anhydrase/acetyltransferase-like protein (isoleucine patch superfamily)
MIASLGERRPQFDGPDHFIAHNATVIGSVRIGQGASIWFNVVIRGDNDWIEIGEGSNVQDASVLHTDSGIRLQIGNNVTVGHRVMLHGCTIGDGCLIGIGSTILNNARIGKNCLVGAHSLITEGKVFPDGVLILGSPARVMRPLHADEFSLLKEAARHYVENGRRYAREFAGHAVIEE